MGDGKPHTKEVPLVRHETGVKSSTQRNSRLPVHMNDAKVDDAREGRSRPKQGYVLLQHARTHAALLSRPSLSTKGRHNPHTLVELTSLSMKDKSCSSIVEERRRVTRTLSLVGARKVGGGGADSKTPAPAISAAMGALRPST